MSVCVSVFRCLLKLSTSPFERRSLGESRARHFSCTGWPGRPRGLLSLLPIHRRDRHLSPCLAFTWVLGIQTQVLILLQQALYPLSHLPKPTTIPSLQFLPYPTPQRFPSNFLCSIFWRLYWILLMLPKIFLKKNKMIRSIITDLLRFNFYKHLLVTEHTYAPLT